MIEKDGLIRFFEEHQRLLDDGALNLLLATERPFDLSRALLEGNPGDLVITAPLVERFLGEFRKAAEVPPYEVVIQGYSPPAAALDPKEAFGRLFADRYRRLHQMLRGSSALKNLVSAHEISRHPGEEISIIGMIKEIRTTKQRHILLTLDDPTGEATVLVPVDSPHLKEPFLPDEVVGLRLWMSSGEGSIARVKDVARPGATGSRPHARASRPSRVVFLSDLHVGSKMFLHDAWDQLTAFLRGETGDSEAIADLRHVVIAGDLVDGIGIYPNQEKDLEISDVMEQYKEFGRRMKELPPALNIVVIPGNHDAVCIAEPQPPLADELTKYFPSNVRIAGNPSTFSLDGVVVEAYHGKGFDEIIPAIPSARYSEPTKVMKRMLAMRHLSPIYGQKNPLAPLARDGMVVDPVPDIFVTGHTHTSGEELYQGTLLLNASAWIAETEYQRMRNVKPDPGKAYIVSLADLGVTKLAFKVPPSGKES